MPGFDHVPSGRGDRGARRICMRSRVVGQHRLAFTLGGLEGRLEAVLALRQEALVPPGLREGGAGLAGRAAASSGGTQACRLRAGREGMTS
jgi:hypothetical protein